MSALQPTTRECRKALASALSLLVGWILLVNWTLLASAQLPSQSGPAATSQATPGNTAANPALDQANAALQAADPPSAATLLSANQIIATLHQRPEIVVDLKQVTSQFFARQGLALQEDSISDEMLFKVIASNIGLRRDLSAWLRARGYIADTAFERTVEVEDPKSALEQRTLSQLDLDPALPADPREMSRAEEDAILQGVPLASTRETRAAPSTLGVAERTPPLSSVPEQRKLGSKTPESETPTQDVDLVHQPTPSNLQSMRDLYTQVPEQASHAKRFGADVFLNRGPAAREMPIDLPIGPDYILGPGDAVAISLWGSVSQTFHRVVDREGRVTLPDAGPLNVAGLSLERVQSLIAGALSRQFHEAHVVVSLAHLRTVRIYVVGDVQRPGAYDISSLSTPLNALIAAGGPTSIGSLRSVRHLRGRISLGDVDLYEFLEGGVTPSAERLEAGDTLFVPPVGPQAEVTGMVKRPAIYEMKGSGTTLADVLQAAGGVQATAAMTHIRIDRIDASGHRETTDLALGPAATPDTMREKMRATAIHDGDKIVVAPILPYSEKVIYLAGHFVRPGRVGFHEPMTLSDVIRSYQDLLPEPADRGQIIRLMVPDLHPEAIEFNLAEVLAGNVAMHLQPYDTVRIAGRYEVDAPRVTVRGEVLRPGHYALTEGMTAAQLVRIAGGFKRSALLSDADLASYEVKDGQRVVGVRNTVAIGQAVQDAAPHADVRLRPGDVLTIHQISGWNDIGASVTLSGEVVFPGTYGLQEGEKLSSVLQRAGGFRNTAYPDGAFMIRQQVKDLEQKSRAELIRQIETTSAGARLGSRVGDGNDNATLQLLVQQQDQVLQSLRTQPVVGRLVIDVGLNVSAWRDTPADVEMRSGDVVNVPKRPGFVLVSGQAYNASAITFVPGKDAAWYLHQAGGATDVANRKEIFVIRANGSVVGRRSGNWHENVLSARLNPGDVVVVPQRIVGGSTFWKNTLAAAQVASSIAFTAALTLH